MLAIQTRKQKIPHCRNNISVISWRSVLLVEEIRVPGENHRPAASHWQTLSHNVVHLALIKIRTRHRLWSRPECGYSDNVCFWNNSVLAALFLVYKFPLMSHLYLQYQMVIFANAPEISSILPMTAILHVVYTFLYIQNCKSVIPP